MPTNAAHQAERILLSDGPDGTDQTIQAMARAAMGEHGAGSPRIIDLARDIISGVPERDQIGEVEAIHRFVMLHLRYVRDPLWYESITMPETMAFERQAGDCDDHAVLEAALLGSIGIQTRFVTYAFKGSPIMSHVALHAKVGNDWIPLDPIVKNKSAGWEVPDSTTRVLYGVNTPTGTAVRVFSVTNALSSGIVLIVLGAITWFSIRKKKKAGASWN
jgi:transglutaminase-like putative cysteine protease